MVGADFRPSHMYQDVRARHLIRLFEDAGNAGHETPRCKGGTVSGHVRLSAISGTRAAHHRIDDRYAKLDARNSQ